MKKYFINLILIFTLIITQLPVSAATADQVTRQENEIKSIINEIAELDNQTNTIESQINQLNQDIEQTSKELEQAQQDQLELKEESGNRMRAAYMYGTNGYSDYLFSTSNPTDFISYYDITRDILTADQVVLEQLEAKKTEIQNLQNQQIAQRDQLVNSKNQADALRNAKQETLNANQQLLQVLQTQLNAQQAVDQNATVPRTQVTDQMQNSVTVSSSVPSVITVPSSTTQEQPQPQPTQEGTVTQQVDGQSQEGSEQIVDTQEASSATLAPRWLKQKTENQGDILSSGSYNAFSSVVEGDNPYVLEVPNTEGSTTQIPRSEFPSSFYWPLDASKDNSFAITSLIGHRESPGGIGSSDHKGIDIGADYGTAILAAASGTVEVANVYGGYGNCVVINHGNGLKTVYGHMSSIGVSNGQQVQAGQIIGFVGSTGWSTGPHLHFEVRYNNGSVDTTLNGLSLYGSDILNRLVYYC